MRYFAFLFLCFFLSFLPVNASELEKHLQLITLEVKTYQLPDSESLVLYGAKRRRFFTDTSYWGEAGYGAISGKRSGYLEGGIFMGKQAQINGLFYYDLRLFTGAGGGGSAPQGGGFIIHPTVGVGMLYSKKWLYFMEVGYIKFMNGDIMSPTFSFSVNRRFWNLEVFSDD